MTRRGRAWAVSAVVLVVLTVTAAVLAPIPFVTRSPGPVFNILGTVEDTESVNNGKEVLQISGAPTHPTSGVLDMTTVAESGGASAPLNVGSALVGLFTPNTSVLPDEGGEDDQQANEAVFDASQSQALGAAAGYLDRPVHTRVKVVQVPADSPSHGILEPGDVVLAVDGEKIDNRDELVKIIGSHPIGTTMQFTIRRDDKVSDVAVTSVADDEDPERPVVGILAQDTYTSDFTATVNLEGIGGPSAGLMLSVGMVDKLTPGDLLGGHKIAGTGTIDGSGAVGPIGGIDKKMIAAQAAGAELFIAPRDNCVEVIAAQPEGLQVVPVTSLEETMAVLADWRANTPLLGCPRTGDE